MPAYSSPSEQDAALEFTQIGVKMPVVSLQLLFPGNLHQGVKHGKRLRTVQ